MIHPEDRRAAVLAIFIAAASTLIGGAIEWGFEEAKRRAAERREKGGRS